MKNAYLQHGKFGGPYQTEPVPLKTTHHVPQKGRTQTGYGGRIPTEYMIRWRGRWHRVLCMIYSNSGTLYIHTNDPDSDRGRICVHIQ